MQRDGEVGSRCIKKKGQDGIFTPNETIVNHISDHTNGDSCVISFGS